MVAVKEALKNHQINLHKNMQKVSEGFTSWLSSLSGWIRADSNEAHTYIAPVDAKPVPIVMVSPVVIYGVEVTLETRIVIAGAIGMVTVKEALKNHQINLHENMQKVSEGFTSWLSSLSG